MKSSDEKKLEIQYQGGHCSLSDYIKMFKDKGLKIPGDVIVSTFKFMVEFVLFFYEECGFFHGDLKPTNLILTHKGNS